MTLDPASIGRTTAPALHPYRWQDVVLYALGVGARQAELDFLFEGRGPKVLPTYAVVPAFAPVADLFGSLGGNLLGVVHGGQTVRLHAPFAPSGTLTTVGKVGGVWDLKRLATALFTTETRDESGTLLAETEWNIIYRFDGGFGGSPPPKRPVVKVPERTPDWTHEETTAPEQALLYRLSGDHNPLHADPEIGEKVGFGRPILHGLCTYGIVGRAVLIHACGGDPARLRAYSGEFKKPVWPGDTLVTDAWIESERIVLRAWVKERPGEPVFGGWAVTG